MPNPFPYTLDNKRYHTWNYHLRKTFGRKVMKIPLNAGFTCPNIDGTKGTGGCIYCSGKGSGDFAGDPGIDTAKQFESVKEKIGSKWPQAKYIAYFQAFSNTYTDAETLRSKVEPVLAIPDVVGVSIATRADCLSPDIIAYLDELGKRVWLSVELGLQSIHDQTAAAINRCHDYGEFLEGYRLLQGVGIRICVHLINGLPGETPEMMLETARQVGLLRPHSVKIHMLHIIEGTAAAGLWRQGRLPLLSREQYVDITVSQLELLPAETVIQRLTGDGVGEDLLAPDWTRKKTVVLNEIDKEMVRRGCFQGMRFSAGEGGPPASRLR